MAASPVSPLGRVHLIYCRRDGHAVARDIRDALIKRGVDTTYDVTGSPTAPGARTAAQEMVGGATTVVVCATPGISTDLLAIDELAHAHALGKRLIALVIGAGALPEAIRVAERFSVSSSADATACMLALVDREGQQIGAGSTAAELEERHLQLLTAKFSHWPELYTELSGRLKRGTPIPHFVSSVAAAYLIRYEHYLEGTEDLDPDSAQDEALQGFDELFDTVLDLRQVAIVGEPGSGKTATLERLTQQLATRRLTGDRTAPLPLLADLAAYEGGSFDTFLDDNFGGLRYSSYSPQHVALVLDGLNEMTPSARSEFLAWLSRNPSAAVIVACRTADFTQQRIHLRRVELLPFDVDRINHLISRFLDASRAEDLFWSLAGQNALEGWRWLKARSPDATFADFWHEDIGPCPSWDVPQYHIYRIQHELKEGGILPGLLGVVRNPLLLLFAIRLYSQSGSLPENRGKLFERFVRMLLSRHPSDANGMHEVPLDKQLRALSDLAVELLESGRRTRMTRVGALEVIRTSLTGVQPEQFLRLASDAGVVEVEAHFRFCHQLVQEYFASYALERAIRDGAGAEHYWPGDRWWETTGWEEPAVLLAGLHGDSTDVAEWLRRVNPTLAYRCATASGAPCAHATLRKLTNPPEGSRQCPIARAAWGREVADQDDRPGVGVTAHSSSFVATPGGIAWCEVPPGEFVLGDDPSAWNPRPPVLASLPYTFWIAKYPTTYAQFALFIADDGYSQDHLWSQAGRDWRASRRAPRYWNDPRYHLRNHPVIGLSWFEASAYAAWVNQRAADQGLAPRSRLIRLPTETEWERAARFPDDRIFPWGNEYVPGFANIDETDDSRRVGPYNLRRTTAVGLYPQGRNPTLDIWDFAGSVWEWCQTKWSPTSNPEREDNDSEGTDDRVLRGGSWSNNECLARSSSRHRYPPSDNGDRRGVRLCLVQN